jgi:hypothetical protein
MQDVPLMAVYVTLYVVEPFSMSPQIRHSTA